VRENQPRGTLAGTLSAHDPNHTSDHFALRLVRGPASADDRYFRIVGGHLDTAARFDYEVRSSYEIWVRVTDAAGRSTVRTFTVRVNDVHEGQATSDLGCFDPFVRKVSFSSRSRRVNFHAFLLRPSRGVQSR